MKSASYALDHPFVLNELSSELSTDRSFGLEIALVVVLSALHPSGRSARLMARSRGLVATGLGEVAGSAGRSICVQPTIRVALRARTKVTIEFFRRTVIQPDKPPASNIGHQWLNGVKQFGCVPCGSKANLSPLKRKPILSPHGWQDRREQSCA